MSDLPSDRGRKDQPTSEQGLPNGLSGPEVSWIVGELDPRDLAGNLAPDFPWRELVYRQLVEQGTLNEADEFLWCGSNFRGVLVCKDDITHSKAIPVTCHRRYCPQCARRAAAALVEAHTPQIVKIVQDNANEKYRLRSIVLTTAIDLYAEDIREQVKRSIAQVNQFFDLVGGAKLPEKSRYRWSEASSQYTTGEGLIFSLEFGPSGNQLHFHCLWFGRFIEKYWMSETWEKMTGFPVTWISSVTKTEPAIREALKYTSKLYKVKVDPQTGERIELFPDPKYVARLAYVLRGSRRVFGRGIFRGLKDEAGEDESQACACGICGGAAEMVNMSTWKVDYYRIYLPAMKQLDLRPGNKSASPPETGQPPPKVVFGKLLTQQAIEEKAAILRSQVKFEDDWFSEGKA